MTEKQLYNLCKILFRNESAHVYHVITSNLWYDAQANLFKRV